MQVVGKKFFSIFKSVLFSFKSNKSSTTMSNYDDIRETGGIDFLKLEEYHNRYLCCILPRELKWFKG